MPYAILRFKKRKAGSIASCERHNERKKSSYKSNPDIDTERSADNYHLITPRNFTYKKEVNRLIRNSGARCRKDSVQMVETLITASPEFMNKLSKEEQREFFERAVDFMSKRIGKNNILSAVVHMDEKTPHMHLCFCPITKDNRLSAKTILGNQKSLSKWQTDFHECMSGRWNELERGQSSMITHRKHVPVWLYKLGNRLDREHDEIVNAITDINMFNSGKKRDEAISKLEKWIPEVNRFETELKKFSDEMDSLRKKDKEHNSEIVSERKYYNRRIDGIRSQLNSTERELEKSKDELRHAKNRINELTGICLDQRDLLREVPEEILDEINYRNERNR